MSLKSARAFPARNSNLESLQHSTNGSGWLLHASHCSPENPRSRSGLPGNVHIQNKAAPLTHLWHFLPEHFELCAWEEGGAVHDSPAEVLGKAAPG